jgi:hypothetical protein
MVGEAIDPTVVSPPRSMAVLGGVRMLDREQLVFLAHRN